MKVIEEAKKINMNKIKQITLIIMAAILIGVGFMNYNSGNNMDSFKEVAVLNNDDMLGDVQLVNSNAVVENEDLLQNTIVENDSLENKVGDVVEVIDENYFENTRLERDAMYSRMLETYNKMIGNTNLVDTQKSIAVQEIANINNYQNAIMISENLIKNKGFEDAVVLVNIDAINVVVKSAHLSNEDIGKIQNIIEREFDVSLEKVNISNRT